MKIAFASCMNTTVFPNQPVWDWIAKQRPDHLVLLGDSIYLDVSGAPNHPKAMSDLEFSDHAFKLYQAQMAQTSFQKLIRSMPKNRVWSIWDDHDFFCDNANGAALASNVVHGGKIRLATAYQEAFRKALAVGLSAGSFPASANDAAFWNFAQPALTTPSVQLASDVHLHLSDGRTNRTDSTMLIPEAKRHMLGQAQREVFSSRIQASTAKSIHLFASGTTSTGFKNTYRADWSWLIKQAKTRRFLLLSGDIHRNDVDAFHTDGFPLHEATSSGAAVKDAVVIGTTRRNFGMLDIAADCVSCRLYANNVEESFLTRKLSRQTWLPVN
jgi:alkaline phosphatase D